MTSEQIKEMYQNAIRVARHRAEQDDAEYYVEAVLYVEGGLPYIRTFITTDFYSPACVCRVSKTTTVEI